MMMVLQRVKLFFIALVMCQVMQLGCSSDYTSVAEHSKKIPGTIDFNYHVKPILSDHCFPCHGPDKNALKADLRLDTEEGLLQKQLTSGKRAFRSGSIRKSEAFQRMLSDDPEWQMPPKEFQRKLDPYQIAVVANWIEQGAIYKPHWAFTTPKKPSIPNIQNENWCNNEIDYFILKKLEELDLTPQKSASQEILLRRATLDLTGLPPTLGEIDDFLQDTSTDAFEKVIDRLLASPRFGEHLAVMWLDLARYADSNGYSQDGLRIMWPWRDWVIKAFNANMPFDQFVSWQIAGDKIPGASQDQILATGFLRNHRQNAEGGIVDEEYRIEYAADRTETSATAFLGLTMQCARCHDHKYDPISQEEYYEFFSFFNNINERGITASDGNSGPEIVLKSPEINRQIAFIEQRIEEELRATKDIESNLLQEEIQSIKINLTEQPMVALSFNSFNGTHIKNDINPKEKFGISGRINTLEGPLGKAIKFTAFDWVNIDKKECHFNRGDPFSFAFYIKYDEDDPYISVLNHLGSKAANFPGYEVFISSGYPAIRLVHSLPAVLMEVRGLHKIRKNTWEHVVITYDGSGRASGIKIFINGEEDSINIIHDNLLQGIANGKKSVTVGGRIPYNETNKGFGYIDEVRIFGRQLSAVEANVLFRGSSTNVDFSIQQKKEHYLLTAHHEYKEILQRIHALRKEKFAIEDTLVSVMVMEDLPNPRPTFVLDRGVYDAPGKQVFPATPSSIFPLPKGQLSDRSGVASWLTHEDHPLTSRVAVNRFWQFVFGQGIVKTLEDFGNQGALPSHPELLDWLAVHFRETGWDIKAFLKMLMISSTYQQHSSVSIKERALDPENRYLARGPSARLSAEEIRDCALAASGLLVEQLGGPSVKPYQPQGLWEEKGEFSILKTYKQDRGSGLYRRSLYTFWRRTSPPPSMTTFDAPTRDICTANRQETNTPLQVLVLLNDPQYVEAMRVLAEKTIRSESEDRPQIIQVYRSLTGLFPRRETLNLLHDLKISREKRFAGNPQAARKLIHIGEYPVDVSLSPDQVAALTVVCSTIMSYDETLVKR